MSNPIKCTGTRYVIRTSSANGPGYGKYRRIAIMRCAEGIEPMAIRVLENRGVFEIYSDTGPLYSGTTDRCEFAIGLRTAELALPELNGECSGAGAEGCQ